MNKDSLLLLLPVPLKVDSYGSLNLEYQSTLGLKMWAKYFSHVHLCAPVAPAWVVESKSSVKWVGEDVFDGLNISVSPLPWGYNPVDHFRLRNSVSSIVEPLIHRYEFLQFAIGGCTFGDWAALGARLAKKAGRPYAVHTDWVTHKVALSEGSGPRQIFDYFTMKYCERKVIESADLGLFHGADCYQFYQQWCDESHLIHNIHTSKGDLPSESEVEKKCARITEGRPLSLVYAGRMIPMKGVNDWLSVLLELKDQGLQFQAHWYGDGPLYKDAEAFIAKNNLSNYVTLHGYIEGRTIIQAAIFDADALLFCHLEPESPRILIEALNQATPIVGYDGAYQEDLIKDGGGYLLPKGAVDQLAKYLRTLASDAGLLSGLVRGAFQVGRHYCNEDVFYHRAQLIKDKLHHRD